VLVSRIQRLEDDQGLEHGSELVQHGAREQFGAITAAALATAAFLLPFVVLGSRVGLEIVHPLAVVMLGGLVSATLMSLFVLPALYVRYAGETGPDVAGDLLRRWAAGPQAPATQAAGAGSTVTVPDGESDHEGPHILPRRRRDETTARAPESESPGGAS
jgi:predicted exporter